MNTSIWGGMQMEIAAKRMRQLREGMSLPQTKIGELFGVPQSSIYRYEYGQSSPSFENMVRFADYFDVSLDYIFGRTDNPQGKLYEYQPKILTDKIEDKKDLRQFIEMCFDPDSPMYGKLKETLFQMIGGDEK
jgi:transcriptional regulator with XRE-family HTH domain